MSDPSTAPTSSHPTVPNASPARRGGVLRSDATIPPQRVAPSYALAVVGATIVLFLLLALYVAIIVGIGWGTVWHAIHDTVWIAAPELKSARARAGIVVLEVLAYVTPIIAGLATITLMLKPLLLRRVAEGWPVPISREEQPHFVAAVEEVAEALGAPKPAAIEVDAFANASARLDRQGLVLTVGMPLIMRFTTRELLGVVAHELGHFRQGSAMQVSYFFRSTVEWMCAAVERRDRVDEWVSSLAQCEEIWLALMGRIIQLVILVTRLVLRVMVAVGVATVAWLSRQMEYDADRAEVAISGVSGFESVSRLLPILSVADGRARRTVIERLREHCLPDNLVSLAVAEARRIERRGSEGGVGVISQTAEAHRKTRIFDSHPSMSDRIAHARSIGGEGIVAIDAPARRLLRNVDALTKVVTIAEYREYLGEIVDHVTMEAVASEDGSVNAPRAAPELERMVLRHFGGPLVAWRTVPFLDGRLAPIDDPHRAIELLGRLRAEHRTILRAIGPELARYQSAIERLSSADLAERVVQAEMQARLRGSAARFDFELSPAAIHEVRSRADDVIESAGKAIERADAIGVQRLTLGLRLLANDVVARRLRHEGGLDVDALRAEARRLAEPFAVLCRAHPHARTLAREERLLTQLLAIRGESQQALSERAKGVLRASAEAMHEAFFALRTELERVPFDGLGTGASRDGSGEGDDGSTHGIVRSAADFVAPQVPAERELGALLRVTERMLERLPPVRTQLAGRLIEIGRQVESVLFAAPTAAAADDAAE